MQTDYENSKACHKQLQYFLPLDQKQTLHTRTYWSILWCLAANEVLIQWWINTSLAILLFRKYWQILLRILKGQWNWWVLNLHDFTADFVRADKLFGELYPLKRQPQALETGDLPWCKKGPSLSLWAYLFRLRELILPLM